jgi:DNA-binding PadR family transcriptional regulator
VKQLQDKIHRKLFLGFMQMHILYHAKREPIYGVWMMEELREHGYETGPGTLYPILHDLEAFGLLTAASVNTNGKVRKYYSITEAGVRALEEGIEKATELLRELRQ